MIIGVFGKDPFGKILEKVLGQKNTRINGHPIVLKRYTKVEDALRAHMLFLGKTDQKTRKALVERCRKLPIFLVGDQDGLTKMGGMANFYYRGDRVRFAMNREVVKSNRLKLSSQLLKLARIDKESLETRNEKEGL